MKTHFLLYILSLFFFSEITAQQTLTLQQCIDSALLNNKKIKSQSLVKQEREIAYRQAKQNLLPDLNANTNQNFTFGRSIDVNNSYQSANSTQTSFGISSNLTLFDGLKMKYSIDARKAEMYVSETDLEKIKNDIILNVNTAFLEVLLNKELLGITEEQLSLTKANIERQKILLESKKITKGELYEFLAQEAKENLKHTEADNNLKLSLLNLSQIIELSKFQDFDIVTPENLSDNDVTILSVNAIFENALKKRPEIKSAEYKVQSSEKNVLIARADYYPTLALGANVNTRYYNLEKVEHNPFDKQLSDNISTSVSLSLNIPVFNRFNVTNRVKSAKITVENDKLNLEILKSELYKGIQQAYLNANAAKTRLESAIKSETATQEAYLYVLQKYEVGRISQYELFQTKNQLAQILSEKAQAKYEYLFRLKILELYNH